MDSELREMDTTERLPSGNRVMKLSTLRCAANLARRPCQRATQAAWQHVAAATGSFFFATEAEQQVRDEDQLVQVVRRSPEAASWFIEVTMASSAAGGILASGASFIFLWFYWARCASCDRPLRWWLLVQAAMQLSQIPVRLVTLATVRAVRASGGTAPGSGDGNGTSLEASIHALTASPAWNVSKKSSLLLYGWFILGAVWWMHASPCPACPGVLQLTAGVMILSLARAVVALVVFRLLFPQEEVIPEPSAPKVQAATSKQIAAVALVRITKEFLSNPDNNAEQCAVCLSDFCAGDLARHLPCRHYFHCSCIEKWLLRNKRCPLCMHSIDEEHKDHCHSD